MRAIIAFCIAFLSCFGASAFTPHEDGAINAIIGNAGVPSDARAEVERLRGHLLFVARTLQAQDIGHLTTTQRSRRQILIRELRHYAHAGVFPQRNADDQHGLRRPRFIDDDGVHCAVGELIRRSGYGALAAAINRQAEFGYVEDMAFPALDAWAKRHGFTALELAMIQPAYSAPPTSESATRRVREVTPGLTLACGMHPVPKSITVHVQGNEDGHVAASGRQDSAFAKCFFGQLSKQHLGTGGAWRHQPRPFRTKVKLELEQPRDMLATRLERLALDGHNSGCTPRPGALARTADITMAVTPAGVGFTVATKPPNPEAEACLTERLRESFRDIEGGLGPFELRATKDLGTTVNEERLRQVLPHYARASGLKCWEDGTPTSQQVTVTATPDAEGFAITGSRGSKSFRACFLPELQRRLRSDFSVSRKLSDGTYEQFFRIDANVRVQATVELMTPAQRRRQEEKHRRELDRDRHDLP